MKTYSVEVTDGAWSAIERRVRYIAEEKSSPGNAARWLSRLLAEVDALETMPRRHTLDELQSRLHGTDVYRLVHERNYLLFYSINDAAERVAVLAFTSTAQRD
ncbi:MAG: type II toxin-antitoxin system RelE/ParE family toxin [Planctomycetota bacterium]